jgi:hypothetical protein
MKISLQRPWRTSLAIWEHAHPAASSCCALLLCADGDMREGGMLQRQLFSTGGALPDVIGAGGRQSPGQPEPRGGGLPIQPPAAAWQIDVRKVETLCSWPCPTSGGGLRNMPGIDAAGECISSQLAYRKRNDLICEASLNLNGKTRVGRLLCAQGRGLAMADHWGLLPPTLSREVEALWKQYCFWKFTL